MDKNQIILTNLDKALRSLERALLKPKDEYMRDTVIQRFEYTFELAWKTLKRYIKTVTGVEEFQLKDLFRNAAKQGLIDDPQAWFDFLEGRNLTSHAYNEDRAEEVYELAKEFLPQVEKLYQELKKRCENAA